MKLSNYRSRLLGWLQDQVVIDSWTLNNPEQPGRTVGFLAPLRDIQYALEDVANVSMVATQDLYILKSFDDTVAYHELPWATLYGYYQTLAIRIAHDYKSIDPDFSSLEMESIEDPVSVLEQSTERRNWIIQLHWAFTFTAMAQPEVGSIQPPFNVTSITSGLWRTPLDAPEFTTDNSRLDSRLDFSKV